MAKSGKIACKGCEQRLGRSLSFVILNKCANSPSFLLSHSYRIEKVYHSRECHLIVRSSVKEPVGGRHSLEVTWPFLFCSQLAQEYSKLSFQPYTELA